MQFLEERVRSHLAGLVCARFAGLLACAAGPDAGRVNLLWITSEDNFTIPGPRREIEGNDLGDFNGNGRGTDVVFTARNLKARNPGARPGVFWVEEAFIPNSGTGVSRFVRIKFRWTP
jgi:hypothetical protein